MARGSAPTRIVRPQPGWAEVDFARCWESVVTACHGAFAALPGGPTSKRIIGIGISSLAPSVAPLASDGTPLHAGIIYEDRRSAQQVNRVLARESQSSIVPPDRDSDRERKHDTQQYALAGGRATRSRGRRAPTLAL